jgi:hypothetical protein
MPDGIGNELADQEACDLHLLRGHAPTHIYDVTACQTGRRQIRRQNPHVR